MECFSIQCAERDAVVVVRLSGELDVATAPLLRERINALVAAGNCRLVLDLGELDFLDASGLRVLVYAQQLAVQEAGWVRLARVGLMPLRVLRLTRLTQLLPVFASVEQAVDQSLEVERGDYDARA